MALLETTAMHISGQHATGRKDYLSQTKFSNYLFCFSKGHDPIINLKHSAEYFSSIQSVSGLKTFHTLVIRSILMHSHTYLSIEH